MCAVPNIAVFCSSLTSCFPGMLLKYFLKDFELVPVARYYWRHLCFYIPHALYFYYNVFIFQNHLGFFLSPGIATSISIHVLSSLSRIMMSSLLLGMVLSVYTCWFHNMVALPS
jgi:hypothetical protein